MANKKIIEAKAAKVAQVQEKIAAAQSVVLFDYRGITVEEDTALRVQMRKAGIEYVVLKNSIVERAARNAGIDASIDELLKGTNAFAFGVNDAVAPAKLLKDYVKKIKKCEIKGGIINGTVANASAMDALADLPPREVLLAKMLGSMMAPITGLAIALDRIREQKETAGN